MFKFIVAIFLLVTVTKKHFNLKLDFISRTTLQKKNRYGRTLYT